MDVHVFLTVREQKVLVFVCCFSAYSINMSTHYRYSVFPLPSLYIYIYYIILYYFIDNTHAHTNILMLDCCCCTSIYCWIEIITVL